VVKIACRSKIQKQFWVPQPVVVGSSSASAPTMRTDLDIGAENIVTTTVTGLFLAFFEAKLKRFLKLKTAFGENLN